eukprot:gene30576-39844_t
MPSSALNNGFSGLRALASVEHSVFGLEPQKSLDLGTIALMVVIIIAFVFAVEETFSYFKTKTEDTSFRKLLPAVESELMVIGFTAFMIKMCINANADLIPSDVFFALEYAEFKIFYNIFCESFRLKLTTFAFDSYVELVFEKFILGLIHIDMFNWVFICAVLGLEWFSDVCMVVCHALYYQGNSIENEKQLKKIIAAAKREKEERKKLAHKKGPITGLAISLSGKFQTTKHKVLMDSVALKLKNSKPNDRQMGKLEAYGEQSESSMTTLNASLLRSLKKLLPVGNAFNADTIEDQVDEDVPKRFEQEDDEDDLERQNNSSKEKSFIQPRRFSFGKYPVVFALDGSESAEISKAVSGVANNLKSETVEHRRTTTASSGDHKYSIFTGLANAQLFNFRSDTSINRQEPGHVKPMQLKPKPNSIIVNSRSTTNDQSSGSGVESFSTGWVKPPHAHSHHGGGKHETVGSKDEIAALINTKSLRMAFSSGQVKMVSRRRLWSSFSKPSNANLTLPPDTNDDSSPQTHHNTRTSMLDVSASISESLRLVRSSFISEDGDKATLKDKEKSGVDLFSDDILASFSNRKETINAEIFFFSRPSIFLAGIKYLFLSMAIYLALWLLQYSPASISGLSKFLTFLPLLLSVLNFALFVPSAVLLKAIHQIDSDAMMEVIEQTEEVRALEELIRQKLISKLGEYSKDPNRQQLEMSYLFTEIDTDMDGNLSRNELLRFLNSQDLFLSPRKWQQIFREMNRNQTDPDKITSLEFSLFIKTRANRRSVAHVLELEKKLMSKVIGRHTAKIPTHHRDHSLPGDVQVEQGGKGAHSPQQPHHFRVNLTSPLDTFHLMRHHHDVVEQDLLVSDVHTSSSIMTEKNNPNNGNKSPLSAHVNLAYHTLCFRLSRDLESSRGKAAVLICTMFLKTSTVKLSASDVKAIAMQRQPLFDSHQLSRNPHGDSFYGGESAAHANDRIISDVVMFHPVNAVTANVSEEKSEGGRPTPQRRNTIKLPPLQNGGTIFTQMWGAGGPNPNAVHPISSRIVESSDDESDEIEEVNITEVFNKSKLT